MGSGTGCPDSPSVDTTQPPPVVQPSTTKPNLNNPPDSSDPGFTPQTNLETKPDRNVDIGLPATSPGPGLTPQPNPETKTDPNGNTELPATSPGQSNSPVSPGSVNGLPPTQSPNVNQVDPLDPTTDFGSHKGGEVWDHKTPKPWELMSPGQRTQELRNNPGSSSPPGTTSPPGTASPSGTASPPGTTSPLGTISPPGTTSPNAPP